MESAKEAESRKKNVGEDVKTRRERRRWMKTKETEKVVAVVVVAGDAPFAVVVADDEEEMEEEKEGEKKRQRSCFGPRKRVRWRWCSRESLVERDLIGNERTLTNVKESLE